MRSESYYRNMGVWFEGLEGISFVVLMEGFMVVGVLDISANELI